MANLTATCDLRTRNPGPCRLRNGFAPSGQTIAASPCSQFAVSSTFGLRSKFKLPLVPPLAVKFRVPARSHYRLRYASRLRTIRSMTPCSFTHHAHPHHGLTGRGALLRVHVRL